MKKNKIQITISIDDFLAKKKNSEVIENGNTKAAVVTHYGHNKKNGVSKSYKKDAEKFTKELVKYKIHESNLEVNEKDFNALQKNLFEINDVPFPPPEKPLFKFIDLFAGIGGFRLAMQNLGGKCVFTSEWDKEAQKTYRANFGEIPFGDITKKETKDYIPSGFEVLCAGFPCQAFSIAGKRGGFEDTRGTLFFDVENIISTHRPKIVFLENVKNLVTHDNGNTFKVMINVLEKKLKYKVFYQVLNSMTHANIPQNRERIFIVAFDPIQVKSWAKFKFPEPIPLKKTIHDIIDESKQDDKYYYKKEHIYYSELLKCIKSSNTVYQWRRIYVRENKNSVCPTLTANMGAGGHNVPLIKDKYGIRKLTPKECFGFQGFPTSKFKLPAISNSSLYMQAGNSVTTILIERIGQKIIKLL